ncbi:hypothetical protein BCR44DRAFT_1436809 [Catenaria anguillulae PL171]|uniref:MutL C-terminal dimerisation domain-containing protein n=1 Tax=Catenaria anguillulae PL171 TaxID=765915 RepID=A0A1Y2HI41_9FUNG|nr:hypothetical protein BCR44DRAFT_1436809 [Catenaria anguillulae PL171]
MKPLSSSSSTLPSNSLAAARAGRVGVTSNSKHVQALPTDAVSRISAHQVIADLATAIKELVDNAIDAGATRIDVRLVNHGLDSFSVTDNGSGIPPADHALVATQSATSKLRSMDDLDAVMAGGSLGFRGQAMHALCALSQQVIITTRAEEMTVAAAKLVFDKEGKLVSSSPISATRGTTVQVQGLFAALPVRASELKANAKREFAKTVALLQHYAVSCVKQRIMVTHIMGGRLSTIFATPIPPVNGDPKPLTANLAAVFDASAVRQWAAVEWTMDRRAITITGGICVGPTNARPASDRQFVFVNKRPVDIPKLSKLVTQVYRELYPEKRSQYPVFVLDMVVPAGEVDVNVTPDKRTVMLWREGDVLAGFRDYLTSSILAPTSTTLSVNSLTQPDNSDDILAPSSSPFSSQSDQPLAYTSQSRFQSPVHSQSCSHQTPKTGLRQSRSTPLSSSAASSTTPSIVTPTSLRLKRRLAALTASPTPASKTRRLIPPASGPVPARSSALRSEDAACLDADDDSADMMMVDSSALQNGCCNHQDGQDDNPSTFDPIDPEVQRSLSKSDFAGMRVIGQFNLGFIVTQHGSDLYLVDQHAADEKSTFERLLAQHHGETDGGNGIQRLVRPIPVMVPPDLVHVALDDPRVTASGFHVSERNAEEEAVAAFGQVWLDAVPVDARGRPLGPADFLDAIARLRDEPMAANPDASTNTKRVVTDRDRAALASRACRTSVMIGTPLDHKRMVRIVRRLAEMDHPWNCPHGRPTVRHLMDLKDVENWRESVLEMVAPVEAEEDQVDAVQEDEYVPRMERWKRRYRQQVLNGTPMTWSGSFLDDMGGESWDEETSSTPTDIQAAAIGDDGPGEAIVLDSDQEDEAHDGPEMLLA